MEGKMKRDKTNTTIRTKNRKTLGREGEETRESDRILEKYVEQNAWKFVYFYFYEWTTSAMYRSLRERSKT